MTLQPQTSDPQGRDLFLADPEPWAGPVDGSDLLTQLVSVLRKYVVLPEGAADGIALWILHTYLIDQTFVSPVLALVSPVKRCGKTTVVVLLDSLARRGVAASNVSPASVFRLIERYGPTLIVDEADTFFLRSDELRGIFNAGHTRRTAMVLRTVGEQHEPRAFSTWCPKAIALIGRLPGTLEDRSIVIPMRRKGNGEPVERLRPERLEQELGPIQRRLIRWATDNADAVASSDQALPPELHDRAADNWRPLVAIADTVGHGWPERARRAALSLAGNVDEDEGDLGVLLLGDIRQIVREHGADRLPTNVLVPDLQGLPERPWGEWKWGSEPRQLARLLKPFGIRPRKVRVGEATRWGYEVAQFQDAFARYLSQEAEQPEQAEQPLLGATDQAVPVPDVPDVPDIPCPHVTM